MKLRWTIIALSLAALCPAAAEFDTSRLADAVVIIEGKTFDNGTSHGTGFLTTVSGQLVIATNQHVLRGNKSFRIRSAAGKSFRPAAILAAADRDVALLQIKSAEALPHALPIAPKVDDVASKGDPLIAPGNSKGGGVVLTTTGKLVAIGPDRIEVDNPIYQGNSGGPIIHVGSGKVIGILTHMERIELDEWAKASFRDRQSAIKRPVRYFGARLDNLGKLEAVNWKNWSGNEERLGEMREDLFAVLSWLSGGAEWRGHRTLFEAHKRWRKFSTGGSDSGFKVSPRQLDAEAKRFTDTLTALLDNEHRLLEERSLYFQQRNGIHGFEQLSRMRTLLRPAVDQLAKDRRLLHGITQYIR
jgi:hypothetical protein